MGNGLGQGTGDREESRSAFLFIRPAVLVRSLAAFLALAYVVIGVGLVTQARAAGNLRGDVALLRDTLAQASAQTQDAEGRLREAQERRAVALALAPSRLGASQVMGRALEGAQRAGVEVLEARAKAPEPEKIGDRVYEAHRYDVTVRGETGQLLTFLRYLDTETMDTLAARVANLVLSPGAPSLSVAFTVYTHPGATEAVSRQDAPVASPPQTAGQERARLRALTGGLWGQGGWGLVIGLLTALREPDGPSAPLDRMLYQAHIGYAHELRAMGEVERAAEHFQAALSLQPEGQEAQDGLRQAQEASRGR